MMETYFLFVLFAHSLQGLLAGPPVEVTPERIILLENRPLEVNCKVRQPIAYCRFAVPGVKDGLSLRPGIAPHEGIHYWGSGLDKGECGMRIQHVSSKHSGVIQCTMGFISEPIESKGNLTLVVARPPDPPIIQAFPGTTYRNAYREGEVIQANCRIINARPVANISWYLGSEPIYDRLGPTVIEEENGLMSISQNITRKVTYRDHGKDLKCVAGHIALTQGNINHSIYKLDVRFPPKPKSQELEKFGFTIGQPGKIVVTFQANPIPDIVWKVDQDNLKQGTRDVTGRFEAGILQHKGAGMWDAVLLINTVRAEEVEKRYNLIAQNELGRESYKVAISTSPEPPADITAGTIVGIVIAVLIILLLVFILIFARATGRWCFAGGVPKPPGESRSPFGSFAGGSQKNPRKVRSLIYKDYTLVEHHNGTKSYVSPQEKVRLKVQNKMKPLEVNPEAEKAETFREESDSDSGYEIPMEKPSKSCDDLGKVARVEIKRNSSLPSPGDLSPGDNGSIHLPPYIVPLETSLTFPMTKQKRKEKKKKEADAVGKKRFSLKDLGRKKSDESEESKSEGRPVTELGQSVVEIFPDANETRDKRFTFPLWIPDEALPSKQRRRNRKFDPNPLKKMFGIRRQVEGEGSSADEQTEGIKHRYSDAPLSEIASDTESADHGSADKSSVSKLTSERQPKKLMSGLLGSFKMGRNKDKVADNEAVKNPSSFEIIVKDEPEEVDQTESVRREGIVYAELDMARTPGNIMRRDDEKTEYAEIIYPGTKLTAERATEELRKSRENLTRSRENLTEVDEAFATMTPDGKKEAAV